MDNIAKELKSRYKNSDILMRIIFINIFVFLLINIIEKVIFKLANIYPFDCLSYLSLPSNPDILLRRIWTPVTYMFLHTNLWHILFNLLWLYWFGKLFLQYFTEKTLGSLYILGGLGGAILFAFSFNFIPYYVHVIGHSWLMGASAAVMSIVMGTAFYRPDVQISLLLLGRIKIIYIALLVFLLDFFSLGTSSNPGGHIAHVGGAVVGYIFATQYRKGKDITVWISRILDFIINLFKSRQAGPKLKIKKKGDKQYHNKQSEQEQIDIILDKLKQSGYNNLTSDEKKKLFDASKK